MEDTKITENVPEEELKPRTLRASESTMNRFKEIAKDFNNADAALSALLSTYQLNAAKSIMCDMKADIDDFSLLLSQVQSAYVHALEVGGRADRRAREECAVEIDRLKDVLRRTQDAAERATETAETDKANYTKAAEQAAQRAAESEQRALDAEQRAAAAEERTAAAEERAAQLKQLNDELKNKLSDYQTQAAAAASAEKTAAEYKAKYEQEKKDHEQTQKDAAAAAAAAEKETAAAVKEAAADAKERMMNKFVEVSDELNAAMKKISELQEQLQERSRHNENSQ